MFGGGKKRARRSLPDLCRNYNRKCGCSRENCEDLHMCFYFVSRNCTFKNCTKAHTLETPRNIVLLERMGWLGHDDIELALENLRRKMHGHTVSLCFAYNTGSCTAEDCRRLHVCHRHVQDGCPLDDCELSHSVTDGRHNARVIMAAGMADTPVTELLRLLADQLRQRPYRPAVCRAFYSRAAGCDQRCLRLHCCPPFTRGQCRYGTKCFKRHNLRDPHNQRVLRFFGWTESQALAMFASEDGGGGVDAIAASLSADTGARREGSESGGGEVGPVEAGTSQSADTGARRKGSESGGGEVGPVEAGTSQSAYSCQERDNEESGNAVETVVKRKEENLSHGNETQESKTERPTEVQRVIEYLERYRRNREYREQQCKERREREQQVLERQERDRLERERHEREMQERELLERERQERERQAKEQEESERQKRVQQEREQQERVRQEKEEQERAEEREKHRREILEKEARETELLEEYTRLIDNYASNEKTMAAIKLTNEEYAQQISSMQLLLREFESQKQQDELELKMQLGELEKSRQNSERLQTLTLKQLEHMECSVCLGVFVRPQTLNCSHTFCQACIESVELASASCPLCREPIRTKMHCLVLDSVADTLRGMPTGDRQRSADTSHLA